YKVTIHARRRSAAPAQSQSASARTPGDLRRGKPADAALFDLWARGKTAVGIYAPNGNPGARGQGPRKAGYTKGGGGKLAANPVYDFVFWNLEGAYDADAVRVIAEGLRAPAPAGRKALIVRIPSIDADGAAAARARVKEAFDLGADGVTIPHVTGIEQ